MTELIQEDELVTLDSRYDEIDKKLHLLDNHINTVINREQLPYFSPKTRVIIRIFNVVKKLLKRPQQQIEGRLVFSIRENSKSNKKFARFYGEVKATNEIKTTLTVGDYVYFQNKFVDIKFKEINIDKIEIAKLLVFLVNAKEDSLDLALENIENLIRRMKEKTGD